MKSVQSTITHWQFAGTIKIVFAFIFICFPILLSAKPLPEGHSSRTVSGHSNTDSDSLKIEELSKQAFYAFDFLGDKQSADSISQIAIDLAENMYKPGLLLLAYIRYNECTDPSLHLQKSLRYAQEAVKLSKAQNNAQLEWRAMSNLVKVQIIAYNFDKALSNSYQALAEADALQDEKLKAESYLLIGQSLEANNQKIEAFRNYLKSSTIAENLQDLELIKKSYSILSGFYNNTKIYGKAIDYKLKQIDAILKCLPIDSNELMWAKYDLQSININSNNNKLNPASVHETFAYSIRHNNLRLKKYELALYRTHLIEADKIGQLIWLYKTQYPEEFTKLSIENPSLFFRIKAFFSEEEKKYDSALYYLNRAEQLIQSDPNKILQSNFYQRFGQFLVRRDKPKEAVEKYLISYELARQASYFEFMLSASKNLQSLYAEMGNYKNAYDYSEINRSLTDSINMLTKNDQLLMLEIDHETKQREQASEQERIETDRRHNIQYMAITIIIIAMFILLMMLGSLTVPSWLIKVLGFFSFILFFEFIIMIADHKIYHITNNEPWKILLIKIGLIAFLLPFHHWIEKKVIQYLINNKILKMP
ncbi:MAG: hypothetical protein ACOYN4_18910, partial [Bacteroidales bacterium]